MKPILNLNKHPKDCENLSLVHANNIRLSNDGSCLQNEENIVDIKTINDRLNSDYNNSFNIIDIIPCNKELIIFVKRVLKPKITIYNTIDIYRYNEDLDTIKKVYSGLNYHDGKIKGTFTYNVNNELIIAFSEYDGYEDVPLRTINLGKFEDEVEQLQNELLPINPEVIIPTLKNYDYISGNSPKGWYYIFIRYKIDNIDYTNWFDFGNKILVDSLEQQSIFKLYGYQYSSDKINKFSSGILDHFSSQESITNERLKLNIDNLDIRYKQYQIAFICINKLETKCYKSFDINISSNTYIIDLNNMEEYDYQDLIINTYNLYNVKNITNYKNRLYISNYKEKVITDYDTSGITLRFNFNNNRCRDIKNISYDISKDKSDIYISTEEELDNSTNNTITGTAEAKIVKDLVFNGTTYNTLIDFTTDYDIENNIIRLDKTGMVYKINCYESANELKDGVESIKGGYKVTQNFKIVTSTNELITVYFYAQVYFGEDTSNDVIYFKYIINNKSYYAYCYREAISLSVIDGFFTFNLYKTEITNDILTEDINTVLSSYINTKNSFKDRRKRSTLIPGEIYNFYIHFVDKYGSSTKGFKLTPKENNSFEIYENNKGDKLFKVPNFTINAKKDTNGLYYDFAQYRLNVSGITLPEGYIGYFISYEKFQETAKVTGLLTKYDFNDVDYKNNSELKSYNLENATKMNFYSSDFDVLDSVNLNYNKIRIEKTNVFKASEKKDIFEDSIIKNINNLNVVESEEAIATTVKTYPIEDYKIKVASDVIKNRSGLGTVLELPIIDELFKDNEINIYKATLLYENDNIYTSLDKELIQCTNVIYPDIYDTMVQNLNGKHTYNSFIIYDHNKFNFNDADSKIYGENLKEYIDYGNIEEKKASNGNTAKPLVYIQMPVYKDFFYETKSFKNKPRAINFILSDTTKELENVDTELGLIVEPLNSIDLFENNYSNPDNYLPKYQINNRSDIKYLNEFDKFIRRSDLIQDESSSNSWRRFGLENYKVISENKGKITNIVGIGYYLLVHTEHSLFAFMANNTLKTQDQDIQLAIPDIFDLDYKELVTSDLGYAGLQDLDAYCLDNYGYIFYDNDSNRILRFDNNKLDYIDNDIALWLKKYKPKEIRFFTHKDANRILLRIITKNDKVVCLSYNYAINKFISFHDTHYPKGCNTKNKLYLYDNEKIYNYADGIYTKNATLCLIINESYYNVKFLEYIIYRLFKIVNENNTSQSPNDTSPVEEIRKPYSGNYINVYNDEISTGFHDISINKESSKNVFNNFNKPYWNKGNWNYSYLRDSDTKSRLYGNYFIVEFMIGGTNDKYEFELLGYNITKDRRNG